MLLKCGIQKSVKVKNLFVNELEAERKSEEVMSRYCIEILKSEGEKESGRVLRRKVNGQLYRYQCQFASETSGFGFSKSSVKYDIENNCIIVVFKQQESQSKKYDCCSWKWEEEEKAENKKFLKAKNNNQTIQVFSDWENKERVVVNIDWEKIENKGGISLS